MIFINNKRFYRKFLITVFVLIPSLLFADVINDLPDFGDSAGAVVSPEFDRRLGKLFLKQVRHFASISNDPEVESYIQSLGYQLASHSDSPDLSFDFFVVNDPRINAFAGPGGKIGMNSGVILNSANESELAAVMAHEVSHVTQRHLARAFELSSQFSLPQAAAILGAVLIGVANPEAGVAAFTGITGIAAQTQINFTRANEEEADRVGIQLMERAGYDPRGMPAFFEKLQRLSRFSQSAAPEFLRTHPLTTSRIADTRARAETYPHRNYENAPSYELVKHKLLVDSIKTAKEATLHLLGMLDKNEGSEKEKLPVRYGLAYAYIKNNEFILADKQLEILLNDNPDDVAYLLLAAKSETAQSNYKKAFVIFEKAYSLYPDYRPVVLAYSRALLDVKQANKARDILKNYERHHQHDLASYSLLGQAEAALGNDIETAFLHAEYYFLAGDTKLAIDKLKFLQQQYKLDYYQEQRASARQAEFEYELELEEKLKL